LQEAALPGEYQFEKRSPRCSACGREFAVGEEYHSSLTLEVVEGAGAAEDPGTAAEGAPDSAPPEAEPASAETGPASPDCRLRESGLPFSRQDFCDSCWDAERAGEYFSCWRASVPDRDQEDRPLAKRIDAQTIYDMFRRLEGHAEPAQQKFRFILALMLMRKKRLKFTGVVDSPHGEHLVLEDRDEGVTHKVLDPGLAEEEIDSLRGQIDRLLGAGEDSDGEASPVAPPEGGGPQ
jgi:hypothetical protein